MRIISLFLFIGLIVISSAAQKKGANPPVKSEFFGKTADGTKVDLFTLKNKTGAEVAITNYGGYVVSIKVPDKSGNIADVVLGYDSLDGYLSDKYFLGATVGRYANRIAGAKFALDGKTYNLKLNDGKNTLHGGSNRAFHRVVWDAKDVSTSSAPALQLSYLSKDGEEGFPGNLSVKVTFTLTDDNQLKIDYEATTDKTTVVNFTNHSYFNLSGQGNGNILNHQLMLNADQFTPVDSSLIPTGELKAVAGTPLDFRTLATVGTRIDQDDAQLKLGKGYDHNWVLNKGKNGLTLAAKLYDPTSGRVLEISTTEPAVQFYSGNALGTAVPGKGGKVYSQRSALCLETQHFPDSPNHPAFPTTTLKPGEHFSSTTVYKFSIK